MIKGSCLCGAVQYEVSKMEGPLIHCHCNYCRKTHAAAFSSNLTALQANFKLTSGIASVKSYESSPGKQRFFCANCGSSLWHKKESTPDVLTVKVGLIDEFPEFEQQAFASFHIHCASDKPWLAYENLAQYPQLQE